MVGSLKEVLLAHLGLQQERGFYEAGFVFTNQSGKPLRPWTFSNGDLASTLTRARITKTISLYSLRHTFATLHMVAGTSMKAVSSVMGHASIQQTGDTYMHSDVSASEHWMKRYEEFLERDVSKPDEVLN